MSCPCGLFAAILVLCSVSQVAAQTLEDQLRSVPASQFVALARQEGDAVRGAIVFYQQQMACSKSHTVTGSAVS